MSSPLPLSLEMESRRVVVVSLDLELRRERMEVKFDKLRLEPPEADSCRSRLGHTWSISRRVQSPRVRMCTVTCSCSGADVMVNGCHSVVPSDGHER